MFLKAKDRSFPRHYCAFTAYAMLRRRHYVLPCPSRLLSVLCFPRILNGFQWNSKKVIVTTNRLN